MKKFLVIVIGLAFFVSILAIKANAQTESLGETATSTVSAAEKPNIQDIKEEIKQELSIKEIRGRVVCLALGKCPSSLPATEVLIKGAKVTEVGTDLIKVSVFGYNYSVDIKNSKLVRHYWGTSEIDEFSSGDIVNVFGYLDENDNYLVHAQTVRNVSIQKVHNTFKGVIENIDTTSSSFVLKTEERGNQTVVVSSETKIVKSQKVVCVKAPCPAREIVGSFADLKVGGKVIVRGIWDKALSKIQAKLIIIGQDIPEENVRPWFKKILPFEKIEKQIGKIEEKIEKKSTQGVEAVENRIKEIQEKISIILEQINKLRGTSTTSPSSAQ